ncbi:hypothetical protein GLOIN_2v1871772 [Rhizophagus irregularis DAOM 181602=DAOM 197198]|nr:hypothetical protein GLOIN_2v1871772 [Rhizophagus irregularis DAOM 181602=DAOM 197198]
MTDLGGIPVRWFPASWTLRERKQREKFQAVIHDIPEFMTMATLWMDRKPCEFLMKCGASSFKIIQTSNGRRKLVAYFKNWETTLRALDTPQFFVPDGKELKWCRHSIPTLKKAQNKPKAKNTPNLKKSGKSDKNLESNQPKKKDKLTSSKKVLKNNNQEEKNPKTQKKAKNTSKKKGGNKDNKADRTDLCVCTIISWKGDLSSPLFSPSYFYPVCSPGLFTGRGSSTGLLFSSSLGWLPAPLEIDEVTWSLNSNWKDYFNNQTHDISIEWNWTAHWCYLNNINKSRCNNIDTNNTLINFIKSSNNLLPTVDNLRKHNDIYDDVLCPACCDHEETLNHLVICAGLEQAFLTAEKEMIDKIRTDPAFPEPKQRNRQELLCGLISHTIVKRLKKLTSRKIASCLSLKIIKYFHEAFREHVWKPHLRTSVRPQRHIRRT